MARSSAQRISVESVEFAAIRVRPAPSRVRFCACDGAGRVVIEASSEDDARYLCRDMDFEFIGLCDD
jgi:hypothetical protein